MYNIGQAVTAKKLDLLSSSRNMIYRPFKKYQQKQNITNQSARLNKKSQSKNKKLTEAHKSYIFVEYFPTFQP